MLSTLVLYESNWSSWLFGGSDSVSWSLILQSWPATAAWTWILAVMLLWGFVWWVSRDGIGRHSRRRLIAMGSLQFGSVTLLLLMVSQAVVLISSTSKPVVALVIDTSASMSLVDDYPADVRRFIQGIPGQGSGKRRMDLVRQILSPQGQDLLSKLRQSHQLELFFVTNQLEEVQARAAERGSDSESEESLQLVPAGKLTDLKAGLYQLVDRYRGTPPAAVVLITDGNSTTGATSQCSEGARQLARRGIPLYVVGVGSTQSVRDLEIIDVATDSVAYVGDRHLFQVHLATTRVNSGKIRVTLSPVGSSELLDSQDISLKSGDSRYTVELSHSPERAGPLDFEISVGSVPGEVNLQNNKAQVRIWSRESRLKVLFVERTPRWEFRHIKAALERDKTVTLSTWLLEADAQYSREDRTALDHVPETIDELAAYDAIVWGDVEPDQVPAELISAIPKFVNTLGGGLLLLPGNRFLSTSHQVPAWQPLLMTEAASKTGEPAQSGQDVVKLQRTSEGKVHPVLKLDEPGQNTVWATLPAVQGVSHFPVQPGSLQVLLEGVPTDSPDVRLPLLIHHRFGNGRVMLQLFDETWRWKSIDHGKPFRRYWSQLVRFLSKGKALDENSDSVLRIERNVYLTEETARLILDMPTAGSAEDSPTAQVRTPRGEFLAVEFQRATETDDRFTAQVTGLETGTYSATLQSPILAAGQPTISWNVVSQDPERTYQPMNVDDLKKSAELTSGEFFNVWESDTLAASLPNFNTAGIRRQQLIYLWQRWELVLLLAVALISEWALRKRARLV